MSFLLGALEWLIDAPSASVIFDSIFDRVSAAGGLSELRRRASERDPLAAMSGPRFGNRTFAMQDGIAVFPVSGFMMPGSDWLMDWLGIEYTNTLELRSQIAQARGDAEVRGAFSLITSPGGTVAGTQELAQAFANFGKPTAGHISGLGASAALWTGVSMGRLTASETSLVGSVGVVSRLVDASRAADMRGIKVHLFASGPNKGGDELVAPTQSQLAERQAIVDDLAAIFSREVQAHRPGVSANLAEVLTGKVWIASKAQGLGLIDAVETESQAFSALVERARKPAPIGARSTAKMTLEEMQAQLEAEKAARAKAETEAAKAKAEAEAANATMAAVDQRRKSEAIKAAQLAGKVVPENLDAVQKLSAHQTPEELSVYLSKLPSQVSPTPIGGRPTMPEAPPAASVTSDEERKLLAKWIPGLNLGLVDKGSQVQSYGLDGKVAYRAPDGSTRIANSVAEYIKN